MPGRSRAVIGLVLCLVLALGGQALAGGLVPDASGADTTRAVGQAASSYLTGLRTFGAAILWNRLDPLMHNYYGSVGLADQRYVLTTIAIVQALDPSAVQSYYVGSWILIENGRPEDAFAMAERGIAENPTAGILYVNLAQLLQLNGGDINRAADLAEAALADDTLWTDTVEQANGYLTAAVVLEAAGRDDAAAKARELSDGVVIDPEDLEHHHDH